MSGSRRRWRIHPAAFALAAVAVVFAADRIGSLILGEVVKFSDFRISRVYAGKAKADVLVLGNSVGNAMLVPPDFAREIGHSAISLAYHGLDARTQLVIVQDLIERNEAPKLAFMEIRTVADSLIRAPEFSPYQGFSRRLRQLIEESDPTIIPWRSVFHLYAFNSPPLAIIMQRIFVRNDQATGPSNGKINQAMKRRFMAMQYVPRAIPQQLQAFSETAAALSAAGTKVIVIASPIHPINDQKGPWMSELFEAVRAKLPPGVEIVDLTHLLFDDKYFEDPNHINAAGRAALEPHLVALARQAGL